MSVSVRIEAQYQEFITATKLLKETFAGAMDGMRDELKAMSDQAKASMKNSESAAEQLANVVKGRFAGLNGIVAGVSTAWAQLAVVVGAGAFLGRAAQKSAELTTEAQKLGRALGVSATQASVINMALGDVNATSNDYLKLVRGLDQQLKVNEKTLQGYGVQTRDTNGAFRDQNTLVIEALEKLRGFKEGTDRNIAATQLFGKGVNVSSELLALNAERLEQAKQKATELGLIVGQENVQSSEKFRAAMNDMQDILDAVMNAIGQALLPVLGDLAEWLNSQGPSALLAIKSAIAVVTSLFYGLSYAVKIVWAVIVAAFKNIVTTVTGFANVFNKLLAGDFTGALEAGKAAVGRWQGNVSEAFDKIMAGAYSTRESLGKIWDPLVNGPKVTDSGVEKGGTGEADTSRGGGSGAAAARRAAAEAKRLRDESFRDAMDRLKEELQGWENNYDERLQILRKMADEAREIYGENSKQFREASQAIVRAEREKAEQIRAIESQAAAYQREHAAQRIEAARAEADFEYALGEINAQQRIAREIEFEDELYQLKKKSLDDRLALYEADPDHNPQALAQLKEELYEIENEHEQKVLDLKRESLLEAKAPLQEFGQEVRQGWAHTVAGMLAGQMTLRQGMQQLWDQMLQAFVGFLGRKLVMTKLFANLEITVQKMVNGVMRALGVQGATQAISAKSTESGAKIGASAATAGAGAAESQASIPYVGPILALAAMATVFAAVMAMKNKGASASAAGGFDIPAGMNPLTQLHAKEMVLPAEHAETIRGMAGRTQQEAGATYQIVAHDPRGFSDFLRRNPAGLTDGVRYATRRGHAGGLIKL
ncbi:hypothetical protein [Lysobacter sp. Root494]|uniref:hypothetical protein n=1 Tax=Lysobacter sp. Root494 TaxID=1736549 RepID=UPI0006F392D9|nr:hypothetical protein [Lysobacter sp. Root494]KQY51189.1 hypothetical protein ASD14_10320 [Lysobacter sp. Root494]